jgi:hypothetical protein
MEKAHHRDPVEYNRIQTALPEAQTSCSSHPKRGKYHETTTGMFLRKGKDGTRTMQLASFHCYWLSR